MKQNIPRWQIAGFVVTSLGGILLHFLYDLTNQSVFVAPFSAVNESTWEHMKLLFFPWFTFSLIQSQFFKDRENFWCVKLFGIVTGLVLIPVLFYTYNGVFGKSPDWINITIFFIAVAVVFLSETYLFKRNNFECTYTKIAFLLISLIAVLFAVFTFATPRIPIFENPVTGTYGINK